MSGVGVTLAAKMSTEDKFSNVKKECIHKSVYITKTSSDVETLCEINVSYRTLNRGQFKFDVSIS